VPAGAIHDDDGMGARVDGLAELIEHELHGGGFDGGQHQGDAGVTLGADRAEQVDGVVPQIAAAAGP